ncbi:MAG: ATP-dependent helicase [Chitinispirillaceae bacterium]|nr:ATP-dependent helicase [Chitinispirillaceae bacterium]
MESYLSDLNPAQFEAATFGVSETSTIGNPLLIIAGAGSGKTNTLAFRVAHLIRCGADPRKILLLTFTRRAAEEMIARASRVLVKAGAASGGNDTGKNAEPASKITWSGTFHSVANRLLRIYAGSIGIDASFTVLDRTDAADLMNKIRSDLGLAKKEKRFPKKDTCFEIYSYVVNSQKPVEHALERHYPWCRAWNAELKSLFKTYAGSKRAMNVMDYDDLLLYWYYMVKERAIAESIGERFSHLLVDEYQDTNKLQAEILVSIKPDGKGLTVVGDDAQAIYSFRAATIQNILDFQKRFTSNVHIITLERNYRSTMPILAASNAVIGQAKQRFTKNLFSEKGSGQKPWLTIAEDETCQAEQVANRILEYRESGMHLRDQAVLFRSSHHSAPLEIELCRRNIPFIKYGGLKFLEAAHIKDVVAALRWVENPRDMIAAFRVMQLMENIGPVIAAGILAHLERNAFALPSLAAFKPPAASITSWPIFCRLLSGLKKKDTPWAGQIEQVMEWYKPHFERIYESSSSREKDLEQLTRMAGTFPSREKFLSDLALNPPEVTSDEAGHPFLDEDYLILSTIHSAKGQEWKVVYIINVADGWIPSDMAAEDDEQIEEERRLLYVAMTRARDHLHLSYPARFHTFGSSHVRADQNMFSMRSRFITTAMMDLFQKEAYGRIRDEQAPGSGNSLASINVAEQVAGMWS